jgi:hypothetical protein
MAPDPDPKAEGFVALGVADEAEHGADRAEQDGQDDDG